MSHFSGTEYPLVSIITVNYKQTEITCQLLDSLSNISYPNYEIWVVDNGSGENLQSVLQKAYPHVHCIVSIENLGFAGGNNLAIKRAKGEYFMFLNNDTEVDPGFLEPLIETVCKNKQVGIVSPKIIYHGTDNIIQYAGAVGISPYTGRGYKIGHMEKDEGQHNEPRYTYLAHGAAMLVPQQVVAKVGMIPDIYFLYYEELDWCEVIKRAGYKVFYEARSCVYHKESVSVGRDSVLKTYYMSRNRLLFMRRNYQGYSLLISLLFFILATLPKNTIKLGIKSLPRLVAFYRGIFWNLTHSTVSGVPPYITPTS